MTDKPQMEILIDNVNKSIQSLLDERKLNYIAESDEFIEGLMIGLEIAAIYGEDIHAIHSAYISRSSDS